MSEYKENGEGADFVAPNVDLSKQRTPDIYAGLGRRAREIARGDLKSMDAGRKDNPDDEVYEGYYQYASRAQSELVRVSSQEEIDPAEMAVGLDYLMNRGERTFLTMEGLESQLDIGSDEHAEQYENDYMASTTMIVEIGDRLFPDTDVSLSTSNYESITKNAGKVCQVEDFGVSQEFPHGLAIGEVEKNLSNPGNGGIIKLEKHLASLQFSIMAGSMTAGLELSAGELSPGQQDQHSGEIVERYKIVYQLQTMRDGINAMVYGREGVLPREKREIDQAREDVGSETAESNPRKTIKDDKPVAWSGEAPQPSSEGATERQRPDFNLKTMRLNSPIEEWTTEKIESVILDQLRSNLDKLTESGNAQQSFSGMASPGRLADLREDVKSVETYIRWMKAQNNVGQSG